MEPPQNINDYLHIREVRKLLGVTTQTLHNWDKKGQIRTARLPSGARMYHRQDVYDILNGRSTPSPPPPERQKILYYRTTRKQNDDPLLSSLQEQFPDHVLVTDVGSGMDWKRKGIQSILESAFSGHLEEVVISYREHLCRFAFDLFEFILMKTGTRLVILDSNQPKNMEQELTDDILSILQVYSQKTGFRR